MRFDELLSKVEIPSLSGDRPWAVFAITGASLLLNVVLLVKLGAGAEASHQQAEPAPVSEAAAAVTPAPAPSAAVEVPPAAIPKGTEVVTATVEHSLARTFQNVDPARADVLSAIYARLFFWDLDLRSDLQPGDQVAVAFEWDGQLADIAAASYESSKHGKAFKAYRFQPPGEPYASWWTEDGKEVPRRLVHGPLEDYEQVTSLLKDRPRHRGMDFKVPVGGAVVSPKAGSVVRTNWNFKFNGNCAEVRYDDGTIARFLHLSETAVSDGQRVKPGQKIGASGNTGRSTAPHLHYELEKNGQVVDPIDYHGIEQRELPASAREAFAAEVERLDAILASKGA